MSRLFAWRDELANAELARSSAGVAPSTQKAVGQRLSRYMNGSCEAWPGVARLARETSFSERTVQHALAALVENGWLEVVAEGGAGAGSTTRYRALSPPGRANLLRPSWAKLTTRRANLLPDKGEAASPEVVSEVEEQSSSTTTLDEPFEFRRLVARLGAAAPSQRREWLAAYRESPDGVRRVVEGARGDAPAGVVTVQLRAGEHLQSSRDRFDSARQLVENVGASLEESEVVAELRDRGIDDEERRALLERWRELQASVAQGAAT